MCPIIVICWMPLGICFETHSNFRWLKNQSVFFIEFTTSFLSIVERQHFHNWAVASTRLVRNGCKIDRNCIQWNKKSNEVCIEKTPRMNHTQGMSNEQAFHSQNSDTGALGNGKGVILGCSSFFSNGTFGLRLLCEKHESARSKQSCSVRNRPEASLQKAGFEAGKA